LFSGTAAVAYNDIISDAAAAAAVVAAAVS